jgi:glycine/D-amino acid oxidase-like deaminating enzyme
MEERGRIPVGPPVSKPLPSYWHEPKSPLANVVEPEVDSSNQIYDYAILGSGISGTMIAYNLLNTQPDARIVMVEAREICSGATGRNGGHTKGATYRSYLQYVNELGTEEALKIARLEYANIIETHRMAEDLKLNCESQVCDTVDIIYDQTTFDAGKEAIEALQKDAMDSEKERGQMAWYEIHDDQQKRKQDFHVAQSNRNEHIAKGEEVVGAFQYLAGRIHAYRFTTGILKTCVRKGLQLCTSTPVHAIRAADHNDAHGTTFWNLYSQFNTITTKNIILATNGYTPYILPELQAAIVPMRGQITAQRLPNATKLPGPLPTTYSFIYRDGYEYMIPRPISNELEGETQHLIIGGGIGRLPTGGASEFGTVDDSSLDPRISKYLAASLVGYFGPETWGEDTQQTGNEAAAGKPVVRVVQEWSGIMGATADGRPFVGEVPGKKGVWICAGFNGHGMVLCLKSAQALVQMMGSRNGDDSVHEWFPESFLITEERLRTCQFRGRTDMQSSGCE